MRDNMGPIEGVFRMLEMISDQSKGCPVDRIGCLEPEDNNGVGVSTLNVTDLDCWETALLHDNGEVSPVERYETREEAVKGHERWCEKARAGITRFTKLGFGNLTPPEEVEIGQRKEQENV